MARNKLSKNVFEWYELIIHVCSAQYNKNYCFFFTYFVCVCIYFNWNVISILILHIIAMTFVTCVLDPEDWGKLLKCYFVYSSHFTQTLIVTCQSICDLHIHAFMLFMQSKKFIHACIACYSMGNYVPHENLYWWNQWWEKCCVETNDHLLGQDQ